MGLVPTIEVLGRKHPLQRPNPALAWLGQVWLDAIPKAASESVVAWARENVRLPGSARSERVDPDATPWTRAPLEALRERQRVITFVKPVQAGGSVVGEVALCWWLAHGSGDVMMNWEDDTKARQRWDKRLERILLGCPPVQRLWPTDRFKATKGMVIFPHANLTVQGVHAAANLDSDSVRYLVNEEIHNWEPGRLAKAYNRTTAYWDSCALNISNASHHGDQLHEAFLQGTQEHWEVHCPGCGSYHRMRIRWEEERPELGGLRYDSKTALREDGTYDYNRLETTLRYQFPCGHVLKDEIQARRNLSIGGRYSGPDNPGAHGERSFIVCAVSVDYVPWLALVQEKHSAIRAMKR